MSSAKRKSRSESRPKPRRSLDVSPLGARTSSRRLAFNLDSDHVGTPSTGQLGSPLASSTPKTPRRSTDLRKRVLINNAIASQSRSRSTSRPASRERRQRSTSRDRQSRSSRHSTRSSLDASRLTLIPFDSFNGQTSVRSSRGLPSTSIRLFPSLVLVTPLSVHTKQKVVVLGPSGVISVTSSTLICSSLASSDISSLTRRMEEILPLVGNDRRSKDSSSGVEGAKQRVYVSHEAILITRQFTIQRGKDRDSAHHHEQRIYRFVCQGNIVAPEKKGLVLHQPLSILVEDDLKKEHSLVAQDERVVVSFVDNSTELTTGVSLPPTPLLPSTRSAEGSIAFSEAVAVEGERMVEVARSALVRPSRELWMEGRTESQEQKEYNQKGGGYTPTAVRRMSSISNVAVHPSPLKEGRSLRLEDERAIREGGGEGSDRTTRTVASIPFVPSPVVSTRSPFGTPSMYETCPAAPPSASTCPSSRSYRSVSPVLTALRSRSPSPFRGPPPSAMTCPSARSSRSLSRTVPLIARSRSSSMPRVHSLVSPSTRPPTSPIGMTWSACSARSWGRSPSRPLLAPLVLEEDTSAGTSHHSSGARRSLFTVSQMNGVGGRDMDPSLVPSPHDPALAEWDEMLATALASSPKTPAKNQSLVSLHTARAYTPTKSPLRNLSHGRVDAPVFVPSIPSALHPPAPAPLVSKIPSAPPRLSFNVSPSLVRPHRDVGTNTNVEVVSNPDSFDKDQILTKVLTLDAKINGHMWALSVNFNLKAERADLIRFHPKRVKIDGKTLWEETENWRHDDDEAPLSATKTVARNSISYEKNPFSVRGLAKLPSSTDVRTAKSPRK